MDHQSGINAIIVKFTPALQKPRHLESGLQASYPDLFISKHVPEAEKW